MFVQNSGDNWARFCWRGRCATHFFRNGPVILPYLSASGARADTYPALRAARRYLRQTYRSFSNPARAGTEMRVADAIAPANHARYYSRAQSFGPTPRIIFPDFLCLTPRNDLILSFSLKGVICLQVTGNSDGRAAICIMHAICRGVSWPKHQSHRILTPVALFIFSGWARATLSCFCV